MQSIFYALLRACLNTCIVLIIFADYFVINTMNKIKHMIWFVMLGLYFSCSSPGSAPQRSGAYTVDYEEDLSAHRNAHLARSVQKPGDENPASEDLQPEQNISITNDLNDDLERLTARVAQENLKIKSVPGFTIQVYSGSSREMANQAKRQVYHILADAQPELKYQPPNYKIQVGKFTERLEAQKTFSMLKKEFPGALIIPDRIQIK